MGQATVDLPDPLQSPPVHAANTDDLLAQLAGEEIDRLLAEADTGAPPLAPTPAAPAETVGSSTEPSPAVSPNPSAPQAAAPADKASLSSAELDDLLGQLEVTAPPPAQKSAIEIPPAMNVAPVASAATAPVPQAVEEHPVAAEMDEDARMSLGGGAFNTPVIAEAKAARADVTPKIMQGPGLPIALRPLEWLNAPLASCPDSVRDTIGKIAILTTVNAMSVLAYVLLFRGH